MLMSNHYKNLNQGQVQIVQNRLHEMWEFKKKSYEPIILIFLLSSKIMSEHNLVHSALDKKEKKSISKDTFVQSFMSLSCY